MNPDQDDKDRDAIIDLELRAHLNRARESVEVPSFESVMAKAEAADAVAAPRLRFEWLTDLFEGWSVQTRWTGGAAVAAASVLAVLIAVQTSEDRADEEAERIARYEARTAAEQQLLASLTSTTRWQAPSDRWLSVESDIDIFGLPDIGGADDLKEESTWL